jgi:hypothetical protein
MLSLAMIGDVFENSEAAKMLLPSLWPPIVGPLLGGAMLGLALDILAYSCRGR